MKRNYIAPIAEEFVVCTKGTILAGSDPEKTFSGENLTQDTEYDPW